VRSLLGSKILKVSPSRSPTKEGAQGAPKEVGGIGLSLPIVLVIVLIAVAGIIGVLYFTQTSALQAQNQVLTNERNALATNYSQLSDQYSVLMGQNQNLQQIYDSFSSDHSLLQGQYQTLLDILSLENSTTLAENVMEVIPQGGSMSLEYSFEYVGYIEIQFSSPSPLHFTMTYSDYGTECRVPADGTPTGGQIRLPALLGSNVLKIFNDDAAPALVTYTISYVS